MTLLQIELTGKYFATSVLPCNIVCVKQLHNNFTFQATLIFRLEIPIEQLPEEYTRGFHGFMKLSVIFKSNPLCYYRSCFIFPQ